MLGLILASGLLLVTPADAQIREERIPPAPTRYIRGQFYDVVGTGATPRSSEAVDLIRRLALEYRGQAVFEGAEPSGRRFVVEIPDERWAHEVRHRVWEIIESRFRAGLDLRYDVSTRFAQADQLPQESIGAFDHRPWRAPWPRPTAGVEPAVLIERALARTVVFGWHCVAYRKERWYTPARTRLWTAQYASSVNLTIEEGQAEGGAPNYAVAFARAIAHIPRNERGSWKLGLGELLRFLEVLNSSDGRGHEFPSFDDAFLQTVGWDSKRRDIFRTLHQEPTSPTAVTGPARQ
jgi:hypothetical protein